MKKVWEIPKKFECVLQNIESFLETKGIIEICWNSRNLVGIWEILR